MVLGTLLYAVVLGFFNDYTSYLYTASFSITFLAAFVMQVLTFLTFALKDRVVRWFKGRDGRFSKIGLVLGVWLIMFLSKFVFLEVIDFIFGYTVDISGFVGLVLIVVCLTIAQQLIEYIDGRLAA
jgi:hypothetical protein